MGQSRMTRMGGNGKKGGSWTARSVALQRSRLPSPASAVSSCSTSTIIQRSPQRHCRCRETLTYPPRPSVVISRREASGRSRRLLSSRRRIPTHPGSQRGVIAPSSGIRVPGNHGLHLYLGRAPTVADVFSSSVSRSGALSVFSSA